MLIFSAAQQKRPAASPQFGLLARDDASCAYVLTAYNDHVIAAFQ
jgi:hypothetical protein